MHRYCLIILLLTASLSVAQHKTITILNAENQAPIEGVLVDTGHAYNTSTDSKGQVTLSASDKAVLSYIGYTTRFISADTVTKPVLLYPEAYQLKSIAIEQVKANKKTLRVLPKEGARSLTPKNYGTGAPLSANEEVAVYIPTDYAKPGAVVTKLYFTPTDYRTLKNGKYIKHKGARFAPFKANIYYTDAKSHQPTKPIFAEDFELKLAKGEKFAVLTLNENQKFEFPETGLCIVVKSFDTDYYKQLGFESAPAFDMLDVGKKNKFWQFKRAFYEGGDAEWKTEFLFATRNEIYRFDVEIEY